MGYVYHPDYRSLWADNEQTEVARAMGRLVYIDDIIIEHRHPATNPVVKKDALYTRNDALWDIDEATCKRRRSMVQHLAGWGFDSPPLWLSIGVLSFGERAHFLNRLLDHLYAQIIRDTPRKVEIVLEQNPAGSLGAKRQRILDRAKGKFVCFVDDDDWTAHDFCARIVAALESDLETDCASLVGVMTSDGERPERFEHSIKYDKWETINGLHVRSPNHLSPVRTEIARSVGFENITYNEDHAYSKALVGKLHREVSTGNDPLYLYWYASKVAHAGSVK